MQNAQRYWKVYLSLFSFKVTLDNAVVIYLQFSPTIWANPYVNQALNFSSFFSWSYRTCDHVDKHGKGLVKSCWVTLGFWVTYSCYLLMPSGSAWLYLHFTRSFCWICPTEAHRTQLIMGFLDAWYLHIPQWRALFLLGLSNMPGTVSQKSHNPFLLMAWPSFRIPWATVVISLLGLAIVSSIPHSPPFTPPVPCNIRI